MSNIRQSEEYAQFIKNLNWQVIETKSGNIFFRKIPLVGTLVKVQRWKVPLIDEIEKVTALLKPSQIIVEPESVKDEEAWISEGKENGFRPENNPYIPTKTLIKDLNGPEREIFDSFSKNKRRDIRLSEKNQIIIKEGSPEEMIKLKKIALWKKRIFPLGTSREIIPLCEAFGKKAKILIAYSSDPSNSSCPSKPLAGTLILFHEKTAYYWQAAATDLGKKLLAPTLIVWEAIKLARRKGYKTFDFEGVYDSRFPKNKSWQGFTHFKEGFRGKELIYPQPLIKIKLRITI